MLKSLMKPARFSALLLLGACLLAGEARAERAADAQRIRPDRFAEDTCRVIEEEASRRGLPASFLARLIWKESLFDPSVVSPKGAQGIAQFMPATASEWGLADPFDPAPSLAASAHFLSVLKKRFGSLGLAAAAYNAGPDRIDRWLAGDRGLPLETQDYVLWITGHSAEDWVAQKGKLKPLPIAGELSFQAACRKLAARALVAKGPSGSSRKAKRRKAEAEETTLPLKRVKASSPGRVRVVIGMPKGGS